MTTLGERIKTTRGDTSREKFAPSLGVSKNTIVNYETDERTPGADFLVRLLALRPDINPTWLLTGDGPMHIEPQHREAAVDMVKDVILGDKDAARETGADSEEYIKIPRYEVAASAGGGAVVHSEQVVDYLSFRAEWVRNTLGVSVRDLALISVIGDSMEPTLSDGDVVLLDMTTKSVLDGSIYALQLNGGLLVKRIQRKLDGSVVVKSDNPRYDQEEVSEDKADRLKIIGRVVWVGRRL
jgi:phage repressor protein C with HTH and peptisase S24 domain